MPTTIADTVRHLQITCHRPVSNVLSGLYRSVFKGTGIEFDEVRTYLPGDDVRTIDWRVTARMKEPYVRRYVEERQLTLWLALDISASFRTGAGRGEKAEVAHRIAALLAFTAARNHDRVGLILFTDRIECIEPPRQGHRHIPRLLKRVLSFVPAGRGTDISAALEGLHGVFRKNQTVFLISDFQSPDYREALRRTAFRQSLHAICIRHELEVRLPRVGLLKVYDAETGETILTDTLAEKNRERFRREADRRHRALTEGFADAGVEHLDLVTGGDCTEALAGFLTMLQRKGGNRHAGR